MDLLKRRTIMMTCGEDAHLIYKLKNHVCDGTAATAINTGIYLFDQSLYPYGWDIYLDFTIGSNNGGQASFVRCRDAETPYNGFTFRRDWNSPNKMQVQVNNKSIDISKTSLPGTRFTATIEKPTSAGKLQIKVDNNTIYDTVKAATFPLVIGGELSDLTSWNTTRFSKCTINSLRIIEKVPEPPKTVQYLQSDGVAYIDLGITPSSISPIMELTFYLDTVTVSQFMAGADASSNKFSFAALNVDYNYALEFRLGSTYRVEGVSNGWHTVKLNGITGECSLDGTVVWTSTGYTLNSNSMHLFHVNPRSDAPTTLKISSFKLWDGNTQLLNMIPKRAGTVGYMYDTIHNQDYFTATGSFIVGPDA